MRKDFLLFGWLLIEPLEIDKILNFLKSGWLGYIDISQKNLQ